MVKDVKQIDPLPESFASAEEAGEFWDTHSTMDYLAYLEPCGDTFKIEKRIVETENESFSRTLGNFLRTRH